MGQSLMRSLFRTSSPDLTPSKAYLYLQDPYIDSFSNHFLQQAKACQSTSLQNNEIHLDDYIEDTTFTFFVQDTPNIKLRRVRSKKEPNKSFTMKYITVRDEQSLALYSKEAEILCQLEHEHVVKAFGYGLKRIDEKTQVLGILMEFFETSLQRKIMENIAKSRYFTKDQIYSIVRALISGMVYLQFKRIFHGNIKPENILISGEIIKISNFANSQDFSNERSTITNDIDGGNHYDSFLQGSLYWAPEYRRAFLEEKSKVNYNAFKVDSFALGLLFAHLCSLASIDTLYKILESSEVREEKQHFFRNIENKYDRGIVELIRDLSNFDEDERRIVVSLCFAPKKSYEKLVCNEISQFYNLNKTDKTLYKSIKVLGSGGFGEVREVKNIKSNERFAEKTIKFIDSRCLIESMEEVLVNASMQHPNIVKFYYYDIEEVETRNDFYNLYCYIELMDKALDSEIKKRSKVMPKEYFTKEQIEDFLNCMSKAMKYMQEIRNTAHSDIKPQNILISNDLIIYKLCDFGISRPNLPKIEATAALTIKGSPLYLAPELREESDGYMPKVVYNPFKSDIFSLGLSLLSMLSLEPFHRDKEKEKEECFDWFVNIEIKEGILRRYGQDILDLLKEMLKYDYKERIDYLGFYKKVYKRIKKNLVEKNKGKYQELREKQLKSENFEKKIENFEESLQVYQEMGDYESMAISLTTLGNAYKEMGFAEKAQIYYEQSFELGCQTLGFDHPRIPLMLNNLGTVYKELGAFQRAKTYFLQAIEVQKQLKEKSIEEKNKEEEIVNNKRLITFQLNLAGLYLTLRELETAVKYYQDSLKLGYQCYDSEGLEVANILNDMGSAYRRFKKKTENEWALGFYEESIRIYKKQGELKGQKLKKKFAELLQNLSKMYRDLKRYAEAKDLVEESLKVYIQIYGIFHREVALSYDVLASVYRRLYELDKALEFQLKAIEIIENMQQKSKDLSQGKNKKHNSVLLEVPNNNFPKSFSASSSPVNSPKKLINKSNKKWSFFESAQDIISNSEKANSEITNSFGKNTSTNYNTGSALIGVLNNLGIIYRDRKEIEKSRESFQKALTLLRMNKSNEDVTLIADVLNNLASSLIELGMDAERLNRARDLLVEGIELVGKKGMKRFQETMETNMIIVNRRLKNMTKK